MDNGNINNATPKQSTNAADMSFLDEKQSISFRIKDIVFLLLRNIHWLIIFAVVGGAIANFMARRQDRVYQSQAKILIRSGNDLGVSDNDTRELSIKSALGLRPFYSSTINNEMMILTSKTTIQRAVEELKLNVIYSTETRFLKRTKNLYGISPVELEFNEENFLLPGHLTIRIVDKEHVLILRPGHHSLLIPLDKRVITPMGSLTAHKTWAFVDKSVGMEIEVDHRDVSSVADYYRSKLVVKRNDERQYRYQSI